MKKTAAFGEKSPISACLPSYFLVARTDDNAAAHSARTYRALGRVRFWWSGSPRLLCFARKNVPIFKAILATDLCFQG